MHEKVDLSSSESDDTESSDDGESVRNDSVKKWVSYVHIYIKNYYFSFLEGEILVPIQVSIILIQEGL